MPLKLNRKTDYALIAMCHLAYRAAEGSQALSAREVADAYDLPRALVMNLLKELNHAGLIGSSRGVNGGYHLARPADQITVCDVIEAVEGPFQFARCCPDDAGLDEHAAVDEAGDDGDDCRPCEMMRRCPIGPSIRRLSERVESLLQSVTLQDMLDGRVDDAARNGNGRRLELAILGSPGLTDGKRQP